MAHYNFSLCIYLKREILSSCDSFVLNSLIPAACGQRHSFRLRNTDWNWEREWEIENETGKTIWTTKMMKKSESECSKDSKSVSEFTLNIHFRVITFCFMYTFIIHADKHLYLCLRIMFHSKFSPNERKSRRRKKTKYIHKA